MEPKALLWLALLGVALATAASADAAVDAERRHHHKLSAHHAHKHKHKHRSNRSAAKKHADATFPRFAERFNPEYRTYREEGFGELQGPILVSSGGYNGNEEYSPIQGTSIQSAREAHQGRDGTFTGELYGYGNDGSQFFDRPQFRGGRNMDLPRYEAPEFRALKTSDYGTSLDQVPDGPNRPLIRPISHWTEVFEEPRFQNIISRRISTFDQLLSHRFGLDEHDLTDHLEYNMKYFLTQVRKNYVRMHEMGNPYDHYPSPSSARNPSTENIDAINTADRTLASIQYANRLLLYMREDINYQDGLLSAADEYADHLMHLLNRDMQTIVLNKHIYENWKIQLINNLISLQNMVHKQTAGMSAKEEAKMMQTMQTLEAWVEADMEVTHTVVVSYTVTSS